MLKVLLITTVGWMPYHKPAGAVEVTGIGMPASAGCDLAIYQARDDGLPTGPNLTGGTHREMWTVNRKGFWRFFFPHQQVEYIVTNKPPLVGQWLAYSCEPKN